MEIKRKCARTDATKRNKDIDAPEGIITEANGSRSLGTLNTP